MKCFLCSNLLVHTNTTKLFIFETNALNFALDEIFLQEYEVTWCPVTFYSRKLTVAEINYKIHGKELFAIIKCFYQWHAFLLCNKEPIWVYTVYWNLIYYMASRKLNWRQAQWSIFLVNFNYHSIFHVEKDRWKPDALLDCNHYKL